MGYNIAKTNLKPRFVLDLLEKQVELPFSSEIAKVDEMELEEIAKSTEDLIYQINEQTQERASKARGILRISQSLQ